MPDKGTKRDHLDDVWEELVRTRHELKRITDAFHSMHVTAANLTNEVEDYKAANTELRYQLELAREEAKQAYKRADNYRNQITALGERLAATFQIQGDLMRQLEEARNG
jgi:hypothetical protein